MNNYLTPTHFEFTFRIHAIRSIPTKRRKRMLINILVLKYYKKIYYYLKNSSILNYSETVTERSVPTVLQKNKKNVNKNILVLNY